MRKMRLIGLIATGLMVAWIAWCVAAADPPVWSYANWSDRFRASIGTRVECAGSEDRDVQIACFGEQSTETIRGLWVVPQDGAPCFLRDQAELPTRLTDEACAALDDRAGKNESLYRRAQEGLDKAADKSEWIVVELELIGRQTRFPINESPVGASLVPPFARRYGITIDRIVSVRARPDTVCPVQPFEQDGVAYAVNCRGQIVGNE